MSAVAAALTAPSFADLEGLLGAAPDSARPAFRACNQALAAARAARFSGDLDAIALVTARSRDIDALLVLSWRLFRLDRSPHTLAAVGGFGRGELHPGSDVDIAVIVAAELARDERERIGSWITFLWDIGLEVGHSVRTPAEAAEEAAADVTVATNLMEARHLAGPVALFEAMLAATAPDRVWPTAAFFTAKLAEQAARYARYDDAYGQLEPNVKEGPGGLRDIQVIAWVANRHFRAAGLDGLVSHGFLTTDEYTELESGRRFLWQVRAALHVTARRREDRLLFDHQRAVAGLLGYAGEGNRGVEAFMRAFYRTVRNLASLNDMLLSLFREAILEEGTDAVVVPLDRRFQVRNRQLEVRDAGVFRRRPLALLELFLHLQQQGEIDGVRASTIRLLREHLYLLDDRFRADIRSRSLFLEIVRQPRRIGHELARMHRYGVLGAYLPAFARVSGLMQFDLFHVYTVDEHTLRLVRNLRRFSFPDEHEAMPPHCREAVERVPKLEILYIAGLFHDIAKGREGDHSALGADEAVAFCRDHGFSNYDTHLVAWLVRNHLLMSITAQRKDVYDPAVVQAFAREVGDLVHLDLLYLLTVADIRATSPALWTSWKASLLGELFQATRRSLRSGGEAPPDLALRLGATRAEARACLARRQINIASGRLERFWDSLGDDYFLRHRPEEVAWHAEIVTAAGPEDMPVVALRALPERGCSALFVYTADMAHLFALTTAAIDRLHLNVQDARIITTAAGYTLDTYLVTDADTDEAVSDPVREDEIVERVRRALVKGEVSAPSGTYASRRHRHFQFEPQITFGRDERRRCTVLEVIALDRPGLLSAIGSALDACEVNLVDARIATFGERAEDYFYITDRAGRPYRDAAAQDGLRTALLAALA